MNKQNEVCIYIYIYTHTHTHTHTHTMEYCSDIQKEGNPAIRGNVEPVRSYAKWYKPITQGQILHDRTFMSYLNIRGRSREDPMPEGLQPRGVTPRPRSGAVTGRRYTTPQARGQGQRPGGATPHPRPGAVAGKTNPTSKEPWLGGRRRA